MDDPKPNPPRSVEELYKKVEALQADLIYYKQVVEKLRRALRRFSGIIKELDKEEKAPN